MEWHGLLVDWYSYFVDQDGLSMLVRWFMALVG
jgi:hypothetical protein